MTLHAILRAELRRRQGKANPVHVRDPVAWASDVLGIRPETLEWSRFPGFETHRWDGTPDPIAAMLRSVAAGRDTAIESGTGTGKTFGLAIIAMWFLDVYPDALVVSFAPKEDQLRLHMWKEVGRQFERFRGKRPDARLLDLQLRMRPEEAYRDRWTAIGFACGVEADAQVAQKARGFHAEHALFIFEEATGIPLPIWEAIENTCTGDHNIRLAVGNPDSQNDPLHRFATSPGVTAIRASALDHPNVVLGREVIPGAVGRKTVERRRKRYGDDGRLFISRVRGISPAESADALIKASWIRAAIERAKDPAFRARELAGVPALGVDVANSENGDEAAIARGTGALCHEVPAFPCPSNTQLARDVMLLAKAHKVEAERVGVDAVGVGAGTVNTCRDDGFMVEALNGGASPTEMGAVYGIEEEVFPNLRSQMWWALRVELEQGRVGLPEDEELLNDLVVQTWEPKNGKIVVTPKEKLKELHGRSPNKGDALVYWNWVRPRAAPPEPPPAPFPTHNQAVATKRRELLERLRRRMEGDQDGLALDDEPVMGMADDVAGDLFS